MKNNNKYLAFFCISLMFTSCLVDDEAPSDINDQGPNLASFVRSSQNLSAVTDGNQFTFNVPMELKGPTLFNMTEDVTATISVDPSSTAIEGVHFVPFNSTVLLTKSNNYIAQLQITLITEGIEAPLPINPFLKLVVSDATGNNVINNGKPIVLFFIYQCFADLSGTYLVTNDWCFPSVTTTITKNPDGSWHLGSADGFWLDQCTGNAGLFNAGDITELCGEILPSTALDFGTDGGFAIGDVLGGTWDAENGVLTMNHIEQFFSGGPREWTSTYTRQ